jgi:hypothetical protein
VKTISIESSAASARHLRDRLACSHKTEFSFLNGNLVVPASHRLISMDDLPNNGGDNVWRIVSKQRNGGITFSGNRFAHARINV